MVELYVNDIANALKNKSYFSALAMSLALPDICGTAEYPTKHLLQSAILSGIISISESICQTIEVIRI